MISTLTAQFPRFDIAKSSNVLVALDYSGMDDSIIRYAHFFNQYIKSPNLSFVHVIPGITSNKESIKPRNNKKNLENVIKELLWNKIKTNFNTKESCKDMCVEIHTGTPYIELLKIIKEKKYNLLIVGKKDRSQGSGITPRRIANDTMCNVLFVPENPSLHLNKIMVPIDFSENSARAMQTAIRIKEVNSSVSIVGVHVIKHTSEEYYLGEILDADYKKNNLIHAQSRYQNFLRNNNIDPHQVTMHYIQDEHRNVSKHLLQFTAYEKIDFAILGAKGDSNYQHILYGRVAERYVDYCLHTPILIVR